MQCSIFLAFYFTLLTKLNYFEVNKMRVNKKENKVLSDSIDKIEEGLNSIVELYNHSEEDLPLIKYDDHVIENIEKAKKIYGTEYIDEKINNLVREIISFLPLDEQIEKESPITPEDIPEIQ